MWDNEKPQIKVIYSSLSNVMAISQPFIMGESSMTQSIQFAHDNMMPRSLFGFQSIRQYRQMFTLFSVVDIQYNSNEKQDTQRTQENTESQPFIDKSSAHYLSYYNF
jgi:hypothetical protein